jgi:hypothetical protein
MGWKEQLQDQRLQQCVGRKISRPVELYMLHNAPQWRRAMGRQSVDPEA